MRTFKGIIALDIDGTITTQRDTVDPAVIDYLHGLMKDFLIIFISGRTLSFARPILSHLIGSYYFAVQNGAALYKMPQVEQLTRHYLKADAIAKLDPIFAGERGGLLIETGPERDDVCYYKPTDFVDEELAYLEHRASFSPATWVPVTSFSELDLDAFAVGKYFAPQERAEQLADRIHQLAGFNVIVIHDPFRPGFHLAHINHHAASKGHILEEFAAMQPQRLPIIAAGDDYNDVEMFKRSDISIVMGNAPPQLHHHADILAPPAAEQGIITALEEAIHERLP